jgi:hypothetical protein
MRLLGKVVLGALLLQGCATQPAGDTRDALPGHIVARPGRPGVVVAAPHATSDLATGAIATEIAGRTGFGVVVATGFWLESATRDSPGRRYHVNRPTEGVPGRPARDEITSAEARRVYAAWEARVREAAGGPLRFYAEIHGNSRAESSGQIEIATVGVSADEATQLRTLLELIRDAHLRDTRGPRLAVMIEPADPIWHTASTTKRQGILRLPDRALHVELPRTARGDLRLAYTEILAEFLAQAVALPAGR